jgi:alanyl aminopeptidase
MAALHDWKKITAVLLAAAATAAAAQEAPGYRLGNAATPTAYEVLLAVDPAQPTFTGEARVAFRVATTTPIVWMHAKRLSIETVEVKQGDRALDVEVVSSGEDYLGLKARGEPFAAGDATATFRYRAPIESLSRRGTYRQIDAGETYVLTQHEETDARRTFPCFDEPGWKTPWTLTIDAPSPLVVAANTPETSATDAPGHTGWTRHAFAPTKPLPSYLVAFAVGPFDVVDGGTAGAKNTPLRYLVPKGHAAEARHAREATPRILELLEEYFGEPYPFEKLDLVAVPGAYNLGAMENVGLVTYGVSLLIASPLQETPQFHRTFAGFTTHELAHMWFGNYVTLAWWDDIWLNESFASWIGAKTAYRMNPAWDTGAARARNRSFAITTDRLASTRPVHNSVESKEDLEGSFSSITYQKGSAVLEMFEAWIGRNEFRAGVRDYLKQHAYGSATSSDFFAAIASASGRGPETIKAFEAFVDQPGAPLIDLELGCAKSPATIDVSQQRFRPVGSKAPPLEWTTPACFRYPAPVPGAMGDGRTQCEAITNAARSIPFAGDPACPAWLVGNAGGTGHYVVRYGREAWKRNLRLVASIPAHEAAAFVSDTRLLAVSGSIPMESAFDLADNALGHKSAVVQLMAVRLLEQLPEARLDASQARRKRTVVTLRLQPLARRVGWLPKAKAKEPEPDEVMDLRAALLPYAARSEGGNALRNEARRLAVAWMRDRAAVPSSMVPAVLDTAARFADRATYELLESLAFTTRDGLERQRLQLALAKVRDPALRARALDLALRRSGDAAAVSPRDTVFFLAEALEDDANRATAFAYVRANYEKLVAKVPPNSATLFSAALGGLCTTGDRNLFASFFVGRTARLEGGRRRYDETLETIDLCIAART